MFKGRFGSEFGAYGLGLASLKLPWNYYTLQFVFSLSCATGVDSYTERESLDLWFSDGGTTLTE